MAIIVNCKEEFMVQRQIAQNGDGVQSIYNANLTDFDTVKHVVSLEQRNDFIRPAFTLPSYLLGK